ncbi:MAG: ADP-glyceromanno-heptose 6-epimerase [Bdellovibrionales bacterium]|nr:ADP-glyceromanno-heptose 6-epimerase [Bdellovibrionales bacterium]
MILVTGAAGFIGSVLLKELSQVTELPLIAVDRMSEDSRWLNLRGVPFTHYIHADKLFTDQWDELLEQVTAIYHMGACSATTEMDMNYLLENNFRSSQQIFELATRRQIPLIYASSAATYGAGEQGYCDEHERVKSFLPLNPYGFSKQLFDQWALQQEETPPLWFGIKFFNVYGPNEYHKGEMRSLVHKAFGQINSSGKVKLFKSHRPDYAHGEQLRDFVYVRDVVRAMIELIALKEQQASGIVNMGTGRARSFKQLVESTFDALGKECQIEYISMPKEIRHQYQYYTEAAMDKFFHLLPHFKFSSLKEGIDDYVTNYLMKDNPYY